MRDLKFKIKKKKCQGKKNAEIKRCAVDEINAELHKTGHRLNFIDKELFKCHLHHSIIK